MIQISGLGKSYEDKTLGRVLAVDGLDLTIEDGEFYTLLGPSGCGKTTTLRCVAGFERPEAGSIRMGDQVVFSAADRIMVPPDKRDFQIVFQSYAVWPHLTVFENVAFPLRYGRNKTNKVQTQERVLAALEMVQIASLAQRPAPLLSGGQQQRVALARALVAGSDVLLLDEPLSNLDAKLRGEMRDEIRNLVKRLGITTLYVTHDQIEALTMSDRIGVMANGRLLQEGSPLEIYRAPSDLFVSKFVGSANLIKGELVTHETDGAGRVKTSFGELVCGVAREIEPGDAVVVVIRPESISLSALGSPPSENVFEATVEEITFLGEVWDGLIGISTEALSVRIPADTGIQRGDRVLAYVPRAHCRALLDPDRRDGQQA